MVLDPRLFRQGLPTYQGGLLTTGHLAVAFGSPGIGPQGQRPQVTFLELTAGSSSYRYAAAQDLTEGPGGAAQSRS